MAEYGLLQVPRRSERTAGSGGLQARLRSALLSRGWGRAPEPRVRFGQPFLPGLAALGQAQGVAARPLVVRAEQVQAGRFGYGGYTLAFDDGIDWGAREASADWRTALHGLDDLFALGVAARVAATPVERAAWYETAAALVRDWLLRGRSHRASGTLPAQARRIVSLIHATVFFGAELRADVATRRSLLEVLYAEAVALAIAVTRQPSEPALVVAGRALFMAGRYFDGLEARGWLDAGTAVLWGQLREQVHEDGGHTSRSLAQHALVLGEYLEVLAILRASNDDVPAWGRKRVKGMADFLARTLHPDGTPALGDGMVLPGVRPARELLAAAAVVLQEPAFAFPGELPGVWPLLILGESGKRAYASLPRTPLATTARALRRTGYYVLAGEAGDALVIDGGRLPAGVPGAFAHEVSVGGEQLIVGAGAGVDERHPLAAYARGPFARNIVVAHAPVPTPPAADAPVPEAHWAVRDGLVFFSATDAGSTLRHRRCVFCLPGRFWIVCDELVGEGQWEGVSLLHLHPDVAVEAQCAGTPRFVVRRSDDAWLSMVFAGIADVGVETGVDGDEPQGWHAAVPGEFRPAPTVSLGVHGTLPLVTGYALLPRALPDAELRFERDAFQLRVALRLGAEEFLLTVVQDEVELFTRAKR